MVDKIESEILTFIKKNPRQTTMEISRKFKMAYHRADKILRVLEAKKKVKNEKYGSYNGWVCNSG